MNEAPVGPLAGKVALITGAARGIGRSMAVRLSSMGADVIALDACEDMDTTSYELARQEDLDRTAAEIVRSGSRVYTATADVRHYDELRVAIAEGVAELGGLDIVCANAGIFSSGPTHELSEESWTEMIDINLNGVWRTTKAATPHLIAGGRGGSMVLTSSAAAFAGYGNIAHYVAAKTGVVGLMRSLSVELAPHRIRVNSINPTNVNTDMIHSEEIYRLFLPDSQQPTRDEFAAATTQTHPMGIPWVEPTDVSAVVAFLASDESRYISGMQFPIMAGRDCP